MHNLLFFIYFTSYTFKLNLNILSNFLTQKNNKKKIDSRTQYKKVVLNLTYSIKKDLFKDKSASKDSIFIQTSLIYAKQTLGVRHFLNICRLLYSHFH